MKDEKNVSTVEEESALKKKSSKLFKFIRKIFRKKRKAIPPIYPMR